MPYVLVEAVDRDCEPGLVAVAIADITHAQAGGVRLIERAGAKLRQLHLPVAHEGLAYDRGDAEEVEHDPAEAPVIAQQFEVARRDEARIEAVRPANRRIGLPEPRRKGVVE